MFEHNVRLLIETGASSQRCHESSRGTEETKRALISPEHESELRADDENRTRTICLEGRGSTIELHPRAARATNITITQIRAWCKIYESAVASPRMYRRVFPGSFKLFPLRVVWFITFVIGIT